MNVLLKLRLTIVLSVFISFLGFAQERQITGTVTDSSGEPLLGATVVKKGANTGATTDFDGKYSINVADGETLVFSYLGMLSQERVVSGESVINITLQDDAESLEAVVVVAQGIKAKPRALSYAVETLDNEDIDRAREVNVVSALSAKTPGVQVTTSSGSVGASANIRIRGSNSILGGNAPLFVVDGIPIDNSSTAEDPSTSANNASLGGTDFSNRAIDLNSSDIESVTLLKGLAAQTLYGIRASNGVVLITTKKGKAGKTRVNFSSHVGFSQYNQVPTLQKRYSQGGSVGGVLTYRGPETFEGDSWGPLLSDLEYDGATDYPFDQNGRLVPAGTGNGTPANAYDHYDFFKTGIVQENNLSVSGGKESITYRASMGRLTQTGISPNEEFDRNTFRADINAKLSSKFDLETSGQYTTSGGNRVQRGSNISGIMLGLIRSAPTFDNGNGLTGQDAANNTSSHLYEIDGSDTPGHRSYRDGIYNNPYFTVAQNKNGDDVNRFIGSVQLKYHITDNMSIRSRYSIDQYTDVRKIGFNQLDASFSTGRLINDNISNKDLNWNIVLDGSKVFNDKLSVTYSAGYDGYKTNFERRTVIGDGLAIPSFFHQSNVASINAFENISNLTRIGAFATGTLDYNELVYITPTIRNDWSSTLPKGDNSFLSYSIGGSFVFSELFPDDSDSFINFGKLRLSYASMGKDAIAYATRTVFTGTTASGDGFIQSVSFPAYDQVSFERSSIAGNPELTPERNNEIEAGIELKALNSRLRFDLTYYDKLATDVIIDVPVAASSGFNTKFENVGDISNKGIEISLGAAIVQTDDFSWDMDVNWTTYENKVESLSTGVDLVTLNGFSSTSSVAAVGESFGSIYGSRFLRDDDGRVLIDDDGYPLADPEDGIVGDPIPDWMAGISNRITYKDLSLSFLFDIRKGGDVWCGTCGIIDFFGTSDRTLIRDQSTVFNGIVQSTGAENTQSVPYYDSSISENNNYWRRYGFGGLSENNVYDASWVRLREVTLSYNFPSKWLKNIFLDSASLSVYGRNLWLSTDYPGVDPETNLTGDSAGMGLDYFNQPNTKSYGFNLNLNF